MDLFRKRQKIQWDIYAGENRSDPVDLDRQVHELVTQFRTSIQGSNHRFDILGKIISRESVDAHPAVSALRHRLDDRDRYQSEIDDYDRLQGPEALQRLGGSMVGDVLKLMDLRQSLARKQGFDSYPGLVMWTEDLKPDRLRQFLACYLSNNLPDASGIAVDRGISWHRWHSDLETIGCFTPHDQPAELIFRVLEKLGLELLMDGIRLEVQDQSLAGYTGILSVPDDIRILVCPVNSLSRELVLYHELGHAVSHALNRHEGIYQTWSGCEDETMAIVFERVATEVILRESRKETAREIHALETARCATSALFELELWEQPLDYEDLYEKHYGGWGIPLLASPSWAADSFRSLDPVYVHHYVIGAVIADRITAYLKQRFQNRFDQWGRWLIDHLYSAGRSRSLSLKLETLKNYSDQPGVSLWIPVRSDMRFIRELWADPATMEPVGGPIRLTDEKAERWFHGMIDPGNPRDCYRLILNELNQPVGEISFHRLDPLSMSAEFNIKIAACHRGKKYARDAMLIFLNDYFNEWGGQTLIDDVASENTTGQAALLRFGFVHDPAKEGVFRLVMSRERFNRLCRPDGDPFPELFNLFQGGVHSE